MVAGAMSRLHWTGDKGSGGNARASRAWKGVMDEKCSFSSAPGSKYSDSGFCF
jgi:hypothetical protein